MSSSPTIMILQRTTKEHCQNVTRHRRRNSHDAARCSHLRYAYARCHRTIVRMNRFVYRMYLCYDVDYVFYGSVDTIFNHIINTIGYIDCYCWLAFNCRLLRQVYFLHVKLDTFPMTSTWENLLHNLLIYIQHPSCNRNQHSIHSFSSPRSSRMLSIFQHIVSTYEQTRLYPN